MQMLASKRGFRAFLACSTAALALTGAAQADVSDVFFQLEVWAGSDYGSYSVMTDDVDYDPGTQTWSWSGSAISVEDGGNVLATITSASVSVQQDPLIFLNFDVQAGNSTSLIQISSPLLSFGAINNPTAAASAGLTLTDSDASGSASLDANQGSSGDEAWISQYNGYVPTGTTFLEGIGDLSVAQIAGSTSDNVNSGLSNIVGAVSDMSLRYRFDLSANDSASGTSVFVVIPEPTTLALLVLGGLAATRRR